MSHIANHVCATCRTSTSHNFQYLGVTELWNKPVVVCRITCVDCVRRKLKDKQPITGLGQLHQMPIAEYYKRFLCK